MSDFLSTIKRSALMATIKSRGNKSTEVYLANLFKNAGIKGWRRHWKIKQRKKIGIRVIRVRPDFVFRREKVAIFIDGCFWHGCKLHYIAPTSNSDFWKNKVGGNRSRDCRVDKWLRSKGWRVLRFWEHSLRRPSRLLTAVCEALKRGQKTTHLKRV